MIFVTWFINKYKGEPLWKMRLCLHNNNVVSFLLLYIHILQKWEKLWNPRKKEFIITIMMMMMRRLMKTWSVWVITGAVSSSFYLKAFILMVWWWPVLDLMMVFTHGAAFSDRSRCTCPPVWPVKVWGLGGSDGCCRSSALSSQPASLTGWGLGEGLIKAEPSAPSGGAGVRRQVTLDLLWCLFQRESVFKHKTPAGRDSLKHSEVSEARGVESQVWCSQLRWNVLHNFSLKCLIVFVPFSFVNRIGITCILYYLHHKNKLYF